MFIIKYILQYLRRYYKVEEGLEYVEALRHINKPSEVTIPNELIPAGVLMQLRGFVNLHVLSLHSDWVWPFWMTRQSSPHSESFIPRAMSLTYINLTHRDWTGVGVFGGRCEAIVDPRGLVTPWGNGWSLDTWIVSQGQLMCPARLEKECVRQWRLSHMPWVFTELRFGSVQLLLETYGVRVGERDFVVEQALVRNPASDTTFRGSLCFSLRPANPEGISLIHRLAYNTKGFWLVNDQLGVILSERPKRWLASNHDGGDVAHHLLDPERDNSQMAHCPAGLCTGAVEYPLELAPLHSRLFTAIMPMERLSPRGVSFELFVPQRLAQYKHQAKELWSTKLAEGTQLSLPDRRLTSCFEANKATLLLFYDGPEMTAGPFTYHRHWFRDAAFMLNALEKTRYGELCRRILATYPARQWKNGYFCAQKGEWDSNGQAIWSVMEHYRFTQDREFLRELYPSIKRGALWIERKRHDVSITKRKPRGLLPAGFSAEHLGPNDFYYWDNFWGLRGLLDAREAASILGLRQEAETFAEYAQAYRRDLLDSIHIAVERSRAQVLPAAPGRPPDAGMIGNICAAYPLGLFDIRRTPWLANTVRFIRNHLFHGDGFYQEMIHSGVNSYLTLQMAQCLLLLGDEGAYDLMRYILELGSPTLCWPEAVHPRTKGGCMGDGHHGWAAAEWILLLRSIVVDEEGDDLQLTRCIPAKWLEPGCRIAIQQAPTYFGVMDLEVVSDGDRVTLGLAAEWWSPPRQIQWNLPVEIQRIDAVDPPDGALQSTPFTVTLGAHLRQIVVRVDRTRHRRDAEAVAGLDTFEVKKD